MDKLIISVLELGDTLLLKNDKDPEWQKTEIARTCIRMFRDAQAHRKAHWITVLSVEFRLSGDLL